MWNGVRSGGPLVLHNENESSKGPKGCTASVKRAVLHVSRDIHQHVVDLRAWMGTSRAHNVARGTERKLDH